MRNALLVNNGSDSEAVFQLLFDAHSYDYLIHSRSIREALLNIKGCGENLDLVVLTPEIVTSDADIVGGHALMGSSSPFSKYLTDRTLKGGCPAASILGKIDPRTPTIIYTDILGDTELARKMYADIIGKEMEHVAAVKRGDLRQLDFVVKEYSRFTLANRS